MARPLRDSADDLQAALGILEPCAPYAEALAQSSRGLGVRIDKAETEVLPTPPMRGVMLRAWTRAGWREVGLAGVEREQLIAAAGELAEQLPEAPTQGPPGEPASGTGDFATAERRPIDDLSVEDRLAEARRRHGVAMSVPGVQNAFAALFGYREERLFVSTTGCVRSQSLARVTTSIVSIALDGGRSETDFDVAGGTGGFELLEQLSDEQIRGVSTGALSQLKAKEPPAGKVSVLLDPSGTGTFAHESFGHGTEADQFLRNRSYLKDRLGQQLAPSSLTLVDDGTLAGGYGSSFFDDEGFATSRTVIIDQGRFAEVLHDRESAASMGRRPTGNARRADFLSRSFVRMTNTGVLPGEQSVEELLATARNGVLLERCTSGVEDPLGGQMQIKFKKGRRIENGQLTDVLPSMALSGNVLEFLRSIRGISRGPSDTSGDPGMCGKGVTDLLPVGDFGTYLLGEAVVGRA